MRLSDDLTSRRSIFSKGWLFLVLGLFAGGSLVALHPDLTTTALLAIAIWGFCRWYYFAFYVVERYVDPSFRFAGLGSFLRYLYRSHRG